MLLIFVTTLIIATSIYCVINIWIKNLLNDFRMNPPRLQSRHTRKKTSTNEDDIDTSMDNQIDSSASLNKVVEISSDESLSDEEKIKNPLSLSSVLRQNSSVKDNTIFDLSHEDTERKNNSNVFDISTDTDSNISDDFTQSSYASFTSKMKMFSWQKKGKDSYGNSIQKDRTTSESGTTVPGSGPKRFKRNNNTKSKCYDPSVSSNVDETNGCEEVPPETIPQHEITIAGTKVKLPVKPYPCQIAVMNKVIQGCAREENCLLESPTGSGKTLALLCGVLAWQDSYSEQVKKELAKMEESGTVLDFNCHEDDCCIMPDAAAGCSAMDPTSSDAFKGPENRLSMDVGDFEDSSEESTGNKRLRIPKIYYGTRTHKQLAQVVKELGRTSYSHKKISLLSSREHTCIQDSTRNKTELCHDLLDVEKKLGCPYYTNKNKRDLGTFKQLENYGMPMPFDIEDLVELGRQEGLCPYFAARNLAETAEIVFCPYNYIIDPDIRESMQINLRGQIVILDEAHNAEDICRNVGSVNFREDDLLAVQAECKTLSMQLTGDRDMYMAIADYVNGLIYLMKSANLKSTGNNDNLSSQCWTGKELLQLFELNGIGRSKCVHVVHAAQAAIQDFIQNKEDIRAGVFERQKPKPTISRGTKVILQHLTFGLNKITSEDYVDDYRTCITESFEKNVKRIRNDTWLSTKTQGQRLRTLKLICMNPAVIFAPLAREARSIILASGTLTPTASFQSELGTKFPHVLSANHVIGNDQVYVRCVPRGPSGVVLKANYQNVNSWSFQDELGKLVLTVCRSVPHGILCFFSSYYMMNTQITRWENSDCWSEIQRFKRVFIEPRNSGDLAQIMTEYRETIEETSDRNSSYLSPLSGAILFAVFRGKVAEGIDFSDNEARCVMSIGIPYPVRKDPEVEMKWAYNDKNSSKGLLKGSEWYAIQAFRALNQAVGRCIRHKNDWGAVLLVDERFQSQSNINNLPKWIRSRWQDSSFDNLVEELDNFVMTKSKMKKENIH